MRSVNQIDYIRQFAIDKDGHLHNWVEDIKLYPLGGLYPSGEEVRYPPINIEGENQMFFSGDMCNDELCEQLSVLYLSEQVF